MPSAAVTDLAVDDLRSASPRVVSIASSIPLDAVVDVRMDKLEDIESLEASWRSLETRAAHSFYLSWLWIGTWLRHLPDKAEPHVITARASGSIVGLAIVCRRRIWHLGPCGRARWLLNETGDARFDRLFIEHNGILAERSLAGAVAMACFETVTRLLRSSDEFVLSGIDADVETIARRAAGAAGLTTELNVRDAAPWVDFAEVRRRGGDYRTVLGRNTRQAVNRAMRLYAERGPVAHRIMETAPEALIAFDELICLHLSRWGRKGPFANPGFRSFHESLIALGVPSGAVRISRTMAGGRTIGVLYNFVHRGHVLNYQSGFLYEDDARLKPGIVSHVLSIEDSLLRGEHSYDFGAGPAGHKSHLANAERAMTWIAIGKAHLERRIETGIRRARQKLRAMMPN